MLFTTFCFEQKWLAQLKTKADLFNRKQAYSFTYSSAGHITGCRQRNYPGFTKLNLAKYSQLNLGNPRNPGIKRKYTEHLQLQKLSIIKSLTWLLYIECNLKVLLWLTTSQVIMLTIYVLTQISPETTLTFNTWWKKNISQYLLACLCLFE